MVNKKVFSEIDIIIKFIMLVVKFVGWDDMI